MMTAETTTAPGQHTEPAPETARLTADVALFGLRDRDLHVLLIRRRWAPYADCWALPGGHVDVGEHTIAAAHRELAEETGLRVDALTPYAVYADPGRDPRGRYVTFAYTARLTTCPAPTPADDATDARWVLADDVLAGRVRVAFDHARLIRDALDIVA